MHRRFVLIGDPVGHSLSPVMHNGLYRDLGLDWEYEAVCCHDEKDAIAAIAKLCSGSVTGMNITMPYKRLALEQADYVDVSADAAGGANVLVGEKTGLHAYNTDGLGALGAIARVAGVDPFSKTVAICGTGPTSVAIACAMANAGAGKIYIFSRDQKKASLIIDRISLSLPAGVSRVFTAADYALSERIVPEVDVLIDATPCGMESADASIIDPSFLREGQVVVDTVYGHGETALLVAAREKGACGLDGFEMLVEQAALSVEIWLRHLGLSMEVSRDTMRQAALDAR